MGAMEEIQKLVKKPIGFDAIVDAKTAVLYMLNVFTDIYSGRDRKHAAPYCGKALLEAGLIDSFKNARNCNYNLVDEEALNKVSSHLIDVVRQMRPEDAIHLEAQYKKVINKLYPAAVYY